jgi:WD40 repeat protein
MGVVYRARQVKLNRMVALKMILAGGHASAADLIRFRSEAEAVARLQHPNIVQIHEVGEHGGLPFFSLEYVPGGSLADRLAGTPWTPEPAARLMAALARAMHAAHEAGVIHRDLKPANVLLDKEGEPKVTDFGLAKRLDDGAGPTRTGAIMGTPSYMAPEQAGGKSKEVGPAADIYALGAILYELLTGRPPFKAPTPLDTILQVVSQEPVPPRQLQPKLPRDLETVCLKAMAKEPARRYPSAAEFAADLRRFLSGDPVLARPTGRLRKAWRWCRRHRALAAIGAVVLVSLLALAAGTGVFALHEARTVAIVTAEQGKTQKALEDADHERQVADRARRQAEERGRLAARRLSEIDLQRGLDRCEAGEVGRGLLWMSRSLDEAPDDPEWQRVVRTNLTGWSSQAHRLRSILVPEVSVESDEFEKPVDALAFSHDGHTILTAGSRFVQLWRAPSGEQLNSPVQLPGFIRAVTFRGKQPMALVGVLGADSFRDARTGKVLGRPWRSPNGGLEAILAGDGRTALYMPEQHAARAWDTESGKPVGPVLHLQDTSRAIALSPDGRSVLSGSADGVVQIWNARTGEPLGKQFRLDGGEVTAAAFSPDGVTVAAATAAGPVRLWNATTRDPVGRPFALSHVRAIYFRPDGRAVLTVLEHGVARLWDVRAGHAIGSVLEHRGADAFDDHIGGAAFSPDGRFVVTAGSDGTGRLWEIETAAPPLRRHAIDYHLVDSAVAHAPDPQTLFATDDPVAGHRLQRWDVLGGQRRGPELRLPDGRAVSQPPGVWPGVVVSADGKTAVTWYKDGPVERWDLATGKRIGRLPSLGQVWKIALSPDGQSLAAADTAGGVAIRSLLTGKLRAKPAGHREAILDMTFSPDSRLLLTGAADGTARLWDVATGNPVGKTLQHRSLIMAVDFSRDGAKALTADEGGTVRLWDTRTVRPVGRPLHHRDGAWASFSPDGRTILVGSLDGTARLWDVRTCLPLGPPLRHADQGGWAAFQRGGHTILAISQDADEEWRAQEWPVPAPLHGSATRVGLWVAVITGIELDEGGEVHPLSPAEWERRRQQLAKAGGEPVP